MITFSLPFDFSGGKFFKKKFQKILDKTFTWCYIIGWLAYANRDLKGLIL